MMTLCRSSNVERSSHPQRCDFFRIGRRQRTLSFLEDWLLTEARQGFAARDMWYDVALVDLEMAPLLLVEGAVG